MRYLRSLNIPAANNPIAIPSREKKEESILCYNYNYKLIINLISQIKLNKIMSLLTLTLLFTIYIASSAPIPIPIATSFTKGDYSEDESSDTENSNNSELDLSPALMEPKRKVKVCWLINIFYKN